MEGKDINIVDSVTNAVSLLNNIEKYMNSLDEALSNCDKLNSDFEHLIENENLEEINLKALFSKMQELYTQRRKIKQDKSLAVYFQNNSMKLNSSSNREFLVQGLKTLENKMDTNYNNRVLNDDDIKVIMSKETVKKKRGRPRKIKEGEVI